jgi:RNA polymerase-binding transcription factor DksA
VTDSSPEPTTPLVVRDVLGTGYAESPGTSRTDPVQTDSVQDVDLDTVEQDLAAVETALQRLSDGTYWTDEVTGEPIAEHVLAADPTVRRA